MLRDMNIFKRVTGKKGVEEIENVPVNPRDSSGIRVPTDGVARAPLNTIQESLQNPKFGLEKEVGVKSKVDRTPTKGQGKGVNSALALRTPDKEKQGGGVSVKRKFGWGQKNEANANGAEANEEGNRLPPSSRGVGVGNGGLPSVTPRSVRTMGRFQTPNQSECSSTQSTPTKSVTKASNTGFTHLNASRPPMSIGVRLGNFAAPSKGVPVSCTQSSAVNTVEVPHFELREDPSFWMDHNVQVLIRIRPLNSMERASQGYNRCLKQDSAQSIGWIGQPEARFTFDHVACESVNQETLFRVAGLPMVENCLSGYNSCMFAYGQTGSGKTYTMLGEIDELEAKPSPDRGMTPRIFEFLFARIRAEEESRRDENLKYQCKCSFLEIYNEQITDLLDPSSTNLLLREDIKKGVYVENLTEFEVQSVHDILNLLTQGAANRKVAATNMNRESSRSHSVFTCVIESRWEKDSTTNLRFARLNLVDLAGSERQKTSGAEGERLKEAASINKSLSTLGHVIMVLVDVAHGKHKHIPYRDSRLTFLLQDSLGGNSKTMIIANVSPSICSAAETLSTLKFAQRAKLIQNNAVVNEDASGNVVALQHQIWLLKEELAVLKRQNVSRSLSFRSAIFGDTDGQGCDFAHDEVMPDIVSESSDDCHGSASLGVVRLSTKQMKSLETTLTGALRREQMADTSIKQLEAEVEQLNRLVHQREEDTQCIKMMLKFREDKVQRLESLVGGLMPSDTYLLEANTALSEELKLVRARVDRNPEVTRFALENIRLLEKLRKFQDFYGEGERELLLAEVSELRDQLLQFLDENTRECTKQNRNMIHQDSVLHGREHQSCHFELEKTHKELEDCRNYLNSCLEINAKLKKEVEDLHSQLNSLRSVHNDQDAKFQPCEESLTEVRRFENHMLDSVAETNWKHDIILKHTEEIMNLQLELDILKAILQEEKVTRAEIENKAMHLRNDLEIEKERCSSISKQTEEAISELNDARAVIEALEAQQILLLNELEDLKEGQSHVALLTNKEQEISLLTEKLPGQELRRSTFHTLSETEDFPLQVKLQRMQDSLDMAKNLNRRYKTDRAFQTSNEQEMDEVRKQVEAETAEVIVCMQEELNILQKQVNDSNAKEMETKENLLRLEIEKKDLQERLYQMTQDKERLSDSLQEKDGELRTLSEEWEALALEIEEVILNGNDTLKDASDQVELMSSFPQRNWISEQVGKMMKIISEKESLIDELRGCLEESQNLKCDMEWKLNSLRGAALAITEMQLQEDTDKEKDALMLKSELDAKTFIISELENKIKIREDHISKVEHCSMVAFVIVNRLSEINSDQIDVVRNRDVQISEAVQLNLEKEALCQDQAAVIKEAEMQIRTLRMEVESSNDSCLNLERNLSEKQEHIRALESKLDRFENEFKLGVSAFNLSLNEFGEQVGRPQPIMTSEWNASPNAGSVSDGQDEIETHQVIGMTEAQNVGQTHNDVCDRDVTLVLLRKEIESALESLKEIQVQTVKLLEEKQELRKSELQSRLNVECVTAQLLALQVEMQNLEKLSHLKMTESVHKLRTVGEMLQEAKSYQIQNKELLENELSNAKVVAAQKTAEASSLLANFDEAQETMQEADATLNALMSKNETAKLEIERLKNLEATLTNERDFLVNEVQSLQFSKNQKDQQYDDLERQCCAELSELGSLTLELEDGITQFQISFMEELKLMVSDFHSLKSQLLHSANITRSWLEEIWSEIIVKDCAVSVLHLCHMGVLLEAVTGLNTENGLLHYGVSESNTIIANLKEHNFKSQQELEMCRILKGKLLVDIKNSFDRVSRKEEETGKFNAKLSAFEKKILELQLQEELMLARSNSMGSELAVLMKELDLSNINAVTTLLDQEKQFREKEELITLDFTSKSFESLILASELKHMAAHTSKLEREQKASCNILETMKAEVIMHKVENHLAKQLFTDLEVEVALLKRVVEETHADRDDLSERLQQCHLKLSEVDEKKQCLEQDVRSLNDVAHINGRLKCELDEAMETKEQLLCQGEVLKNEAERLANELETKEADLEGLVSRLNTEMESRGTTLKKMSSIEEDNRTLKFEIMKLKEDNCRLLEEFQEKTAVFESSSSRMDVFDQENQRLHEEICSLQTCIARLEMNLDMRSKELDELQHFQSIMTEELNLKSQHLENQIGIISVLKEENGSLRSELVSVEQNKHEIFTLLRLHDKKCADLFQAVNMTGSRMYHNVGERSYALFDKMTTAISENEERAYKFVAEFECLENFAKELICEQLSLQEELSRKDEVIKGLCSDLSLLQESSSNTKDQKEVLEEMMAAMKSLEGDLTLRPAELDNAIAHGQLLDAQLQEKIDLVTTLETDISKERKSRKLTSEENIELRTKLEDVLTAKGSIEEELMERRRVTESLEEELFQMDNALGQMNTCLEGLKNDLNKVTKEKDRLDSEVLVLNEKLEMTQALAEEKEAIACEAQQIAETRKTYAEEKEEEIKLLEKSVEELESTVDVLENKVDIVKEEAERQRLQREELEMELQSIRHQMQTVHTSGVRMKLQNISGDTDLQRLLEEKESDLQDARKQIQDFERKIDAKESEISQCRAHISELTLHAEAQAREYMQKFKALETMAEHVKPDLASLHAANSSSAKLEKNTTKSRGSGSPFKCIGLGLAHQLKSEKDEELTAGKVRIEELEALAASRQKEIFLLNARLAAAESMTHDVLRDLLGVKLDITNIAQVQNYAEKAQIHGEDFLVKKEVAKLKQQLSDFIEERQGWLEEINRRHAETVSAQVACEKLHQRDQFLTTENEMLKMENVNHKKKVIGLEDEVKKLSGQQNLQQRIHHHAKIKEENNALKVQNESLSCKLRRSEALVSRVREELARFRASNGLSPSIDLDEEQRLHNKLKETEEERLQLAQKLVGLCTSILKAAGLSRPTSEISLPVAEDALNQLKDRLSSQERELQDLKFKNRITNEKIRLSELKQHSSPLGSRTDENRSTPGRVSPAPYLTTLSR